MRSRRSSGLAHTTIVHAKRRVPLPSTPRELVPAGVGVAISLLLVAVAASGALAWTTALLLAGLTWASVAVVLALRLRARERRLAAERRRLRALREMQSQHGIAEQLGGFGTWFIDQASNRFLWSSGTFRLFGIDPSSGEPNLREFTSAIHESDRQRWIDSHRRALRRGGDARIEYRYLRPGRETIWVRSVARAEVGPRGEIERVGGMVQDITGVRAMQQQLAASEAKFRDLTDMSSDWVWETDAEHRWSYFSDSVDAVFGGGAARLVGHPIWELPATQSAFEQPDWNGQRALMQRHAPFENVEYATIAPDGSAHFLSISGRARFDGSGRFLGYRGVGRDITQEKQQRLLLRIESDITSIVREQSEPERVITAILISLCGMLGWMGGVNLALLPGRRSCVARERWGHAAFIRMVAQLPGEMPMVRGGVEARAWQQGEALWIDDLQSELPFAQRYHADRLGARAAFLAPIIDEHGRTLNLLLFLSPSTFRGDPFLFQVAEVLSRNLSLYLQRKDSEERLLHQSLHDGLTDLPNRIHLTRQLEELLARGEAAAVLYIDLDRYKLINDTLGHSAGDQVLIEVARRLCSAIRPEDLAGRIGGDEFILLLRQMADRSEIERIARRVLAAIEKPFVLQGRAYFLSASIGIAVAPVDGNDAKLLVKCADNAMYRVKSEGRNDVRFFTGELSDERTGQLQLAAELPLALQRGEVDLYYQPIMDLEQRRVVGIEALLRWQHPVHGLLLPDRFVPVAEQNNLIRELGLWALRRALDDRVALGIGHHPDVAVSVNVSAHQFAESDFLGTINGLLAEREFPPRLLRLELTENAFFEQPERAAQLIAELRRLGVQVVIDNFGTGYAVLSYLKDLPVDGIKIDRTFVRNLPMDRGNAAIIEAICTLAGRLGLQAMAEGVESATELKALRDLDCRQLQGTLICEALPFLHIREFLDALPEMRRLHLVRREGMVG